MMRYVPSKLQHFRQCCFSAFLRTLSSGNTCQRTAEIPTPLPNPAHLSIIPAEDKQVFDSYYTLILREVVENTSISPIPKLNEELTKIINYNVPDGRKLRPYLMIAAYKFFSSHVLTPENLRMMNILGWFVEIINAMFVVQDDLTDNSATRRGKATWYKCVGTRAQNDSLLLQALSLQLLKKYFSSHRNYSKMLDIYIEMMRITQVGLALESITTLDEFTEERYYNIAKRKMGFYLFNFTTTIATLLAEKEDLMISDTAGNVFNELAILYTIQNDYMDCYGESITGKKGADIEDGQCTWLIISALKKATPAQKSVLQKCYGSKNTKDVNEVKRIFDIIGIRDQYEETVRDCFKRASSEVDNISSDEVRRFCAWLVKIFFRIQ